MSNTNVHNNPWFHMHVASEMDYCGGGYSRREAKRRVEWEFANAPDPLPCACGGKQWYRATVGAMLCPDCRGMSRLDGTPVGRAQGRTTGV